MFSEIASEFPVLFPISLHSLCVLLPGLTIMDKFLPTQTIIQTRGIYFISNITIQGGDFVWFQVFFLNPMFTQPVLLI